MDGRLRELVSRFEARTAELDGVLSRMEGEATAEDVVKGQAINKDLEDLRGQIATLQDAAQLKQVAAQHRDFLQAPAAGIPHEAPAALIGVRPAGSAWIESGGKGLFATDDGEMLLDEKTVRVISQREYKQAFMSYLRCGLNRLGPTDLKTLQEGTDPSGGFLVPEDIMNRIVMKKPTPTRIAGYCATFNTSRDALIMPRVVYSTDDIYTTGIRATFTGEVPPTSAAMRVTEPVFGQLRVPVYTAMMSMPLTNDLIEDSLFPLVSWSSDRFRETIDLLYDNMILNGSGIGQPSGILMNPGGADQPASVSLGNPITADGLVKQPWALPEQYDMNARWAINKTSVGQYVATLKDANNRYLWGSGLQDSGVAIGNLGNGGRFLQGYPVNLSGFMPALGAGNAVTVFGDFTGYYLVNRVGFSIQVLRELYAETNQVLLLGRIRFGGQVGEAWKLKVGLQQ